MTQYACPNCGDTDRLDAEAKVYVRLVQSDPDNIETEVSPENNDHDWDRNSPAICRHCDWSGTVGELTLTLAQAQDSKTVTVTLEVVDEQLLRAFTSGYVPKGSSLVGRVNAAITAGAPLTRPAITGVRVAGVAGR